MFGFIQRRIVNSIFPRSDRGVVLIAVVGILAVLAMMAVTFAAIMRVELGAGRNQADLALARQIARGGITYTLETVQNDLNAAYTALGEQAWLYSARWQDLSLIPPATISVVKNSPIVTLSAGAVWPNDLISGNQIRLDNDGTWYTVYSVDSTTQQLTLSEPYRGSSGSDTGYTVASTVGLWPYEDANVRAELVLEIVDDERKLNPNAHGNLGHPIGIDDFDERQRIQSFDVNLRSFFEFFDNDIIAALAEAKNGSRIIRGTGTPWLGNAVPGDWFRINSDGTPYRIASVDSDTKLTLATSYTGTPSAVPEVYTIWRPWAADFLRLGILNRRHGTDAAPGAVASDDDSDFSSVESNAFDDDWDWDGVDTVYPDNIPNLDENNVDDLDTNEGTDEPDEFNPLSPSGDDRPFRAVEEVVTALADQLGATPDDWAAGRAAYNRLLEQLTVHTYGMPGAFTSEYVSIDDWATDGLDNDGDGNIDSADTAIPYGTNEAAGAGTTVDVNGTATVTGTGTAWTTNVAAGDWFRLVDATVDDDAWYEIASVDGDTQLTLTTNCATTNTGLDYTICGPAEEKPGSYDRALWQSFEAWRLYHAFGLDEVVVPPSTPPPLPEGKLRPWHALQLLANLLDFRDDDYVPTRLADPVYTSQVAHGVEGLHITEVMAAATFDYANDMTLIDEDYPAPGAVENNGLFWDYDGALIPPAWIQVTDSPITGEWSLDNVRIGDYELRIYGTGTLDNVWYDGAPYGAPVFGPAGYASVVSSTSVTTAGTKQLRITAGLGTTVSRVEFGAEYVEIMNISRRARGDDVWEGVDPTELFLNVNGADVGGGALGYGTYNDGSGTQTDGWIPPTFADGVFPIDYGMYVVASSAAVFENNWWLMTRGLTVPSGLMHNGTWGDYSGIVNDGLATTDVLEPNVITGDALTNWQTPAGKVLPGDFFRIDSDSNPNPWYEISLVDLSVSQLTLRPERPFVGDFTDSAYTILTPAESFPVYFNSGLVIADTDSITVRNEPAGGGDLIAGGDATDDIDGYYTFVSGFTSINFVGREKAAPIGSRQDNLTGDWPLTLWDIDAVAHTELYGSPGLLNRAMEDSLDAAGNNDLAFEEIDMQSPYTSEFPSVLDAPYPSPGWLGFLHSGRAWETLKPDPAPSPPLPPPLLAPPTPLPLTVLLEKAFCNYRGVRAKINLNTASKDFLEAAFGGTTDIPPLTNADDIEAGRPFTTLLEVFTPLAGPIGSLDTDIRDSSGAGLMYDDIVNDVDEVQEEWYRRYCNLFTIKSNVFTVEATATIRQKSDGQILAQVRLRAVIDRGTDTDGDGVPEARVISSRYVTEY